MKHLIFKIFTLIFISLSITNLQGQDLRTQIFDRIEGHWEGAFIKNNSYQKFDIQFYGNQTQVNSLQIIEEWHPQFGEFVLAVDIDSLGNISFNTGLGKANLVLDIDALEMIGTIEGSFPSIYLHFKKVPTPPADDFLVEEISVSTDTINLFGHLHLPKNGPYDTAIILIGGRGCYAGNTKYDLYAKLLRAYGISVLVYNKRGTGKSNGDCSYATIHDLANDLISCKNYLESHPNNYKNIGVLGSSAGAWVMLKSEEEIDFDFMISVVGPASSVKDQQLQAMDYGFEFYKLSKDSKIQLLEYTEMMFEAEASESNFTKFNSLLKSSKEEGWFDLLDDTDIPDTAAGIENLWVRRHNYDPSLSLSSYDKPFLAIYGEMDWIVPYKENINRLNELFSAERKDLLNTVIAHDAEHGTETKGKYVTLQEDRSYWRFFRISPVVQIEIIDFLLKYGFIEQ